MMSKTITSNETGASIYLFSNSETVTIDDVEIAIGSPVHNIVSDLNLTNATMHVDVTAPSDWSPYKYLFDGAEWSLNPDYETPLETA